MRGLFGFLLRREVALSVFLLLKLAAVIVGGLSMPSVEAWGIGILALATYAVIAWFAYRGRGVSIWAVTIIMLYEASGALLTGVDHFNSAPAIGVIGAVVGIYLVLGAMVVFSSRHKRV